jgi:hypothetical protein
MPPILPRTHGYSSTDGRGAQYALDDDTLLQARLLKSGRSPTSEFDLLMVVDCEMEIVVLAKRTGSPGPPMILTDPDPHLFPSDGLIARLSCI